MYGQIPRIRSTMSNPMLSSSNNAITSEYRLPSESPEYWEDFQRQYLHTKYKQILYCIVRVPLEIRVSLVSIIIATTIN